MPDKRLGWVLLAGAVVLGGALRLYNLHEKPMHGDEANQAHKAGRLLEGNDYQYDPYEHHGPTLYYLTLPVMWLTGQETFAQTSVSTYRLVPALAGTAMIALAAALRPFLTPLGAGAAALLLAVSPAFVYYSRYYIQEVPFVLFCLLLFAGLGRYLERPHWAWAVLAGFAAGLMHATKETCIIIFGAAAIAGLPLLLSRWFREPGAFHHDLRRHGPMKALGLGTAIVVSVAWYSNAFTYWQGPIDSITAFAHYLPRSGGEGSAGPHDWPWWHYVSLLAYTQRTPGAFWSEGLIFALALVGTGRAVFGFQQTKARRAGILFLVAFTLTATAVYSLIPYKTPWNVLPFWLGWILLAGYGAAWLLTAPRTKRMRLAAAALLALLTMQLTAQACRTVYVFPADPRNPYVYAHTSTALLKLAGRLNDLAEIHPDGYGMRVDVIAPNADYWPLPWYLRNFTRVAYRTEPGLEGHPAVALMPNRAARDIYPGVRELYTAEQHSLRPGVLWQALIDRMLWQRFMAARQ